LWIKIKSCNYLLIFIDDQFQSILADSKEIVKLFALVTFDFGDDYDTFEYVFYYHLFYFVTNYPNWIRFR
jgi:hypothetical protein